MNDATDHIALLWDNWDHLRKPEKARAKLLIDEIGDLAFRAADRKQEKLNEQELMRGGISA